MTKKQSLWKAFVAALLVSGFISAMLFLNSYTFPSRISPVVWKCTEYHSFLTIPSPPRSNSDCQFSSNQSESAISPTITKTIYVITPTYNRTTQKIDLTAMCHTLMHVPQLVWIVIEDASEQTDLVKKLLQRCRVSSVLLIVPTSAEYAIEKGESYWSKPRGVDQRNAGLAWLRKHFDSSNCNGVFYFGDDDNKYDLRLFDEIRQTQTVSVWRVAWAGNLVWAGPSCKNEKAVSWRAVHAPDREFPIDMAGFAVHLCQLFKHPQARVGNTANGKKSWGGYIETHFLEHFANRSTVECRGSEKEAFVWHSHTRNPDLQGEKKLQSNSTPIET